MTGLAITGWGILSSAGIGPNALASALATGRRPGADVSGLYSENLPSRNGHALIDFDVRKLLGRKGTTFLDRRTSLALVACAQALEDSGLRVDDYNRQRIGIILGTTWGSLKSMSDYTRESLTEERPYLVNPALFPNTVMNCAAGQAAIRFGLKGVNATLAGGQLAFLNVLRYAQNILRCGYADVLLAGAVEEFTPHNAWAAHLTDPAGPAGEGAAVFVVKRADDSTTASLRVDAEVLSVALGYSPARERGRDSERAMEGCIRLALEKAGAAPADISLVVTGTGGGMAQIETNALAAVLGDREWEHISVREILGECYAASGALQVAALLLWHRESSDRDRRLSLVTGWTDDGGLGAAVFRGWSRVGSHCS